MYSPADKRRGGDSLLRYITAFIIVFAAGCGIAIAQSDLLKRGDYLVNGILTCGNCHSPKGPAGDTMQKAFSGGLSWDEPPFKVTATNITQDAETGIGNYSDAELKQVMRKGIKRNGVPVAMIMPSGFYEIMTERDLNAVIAYLRTIKPIRNTVPDPIYKTAQRHPIPPGGEKAFTEAMMKDKVAKGFYRHHSALHGMSYAAGPGRARLRRTARRGRLRIPRTMGRFGSAQRHPKQGKGHRRLDG
jgi:hypothetical protein